MFSNFVAHKNYATGVFNKAINMIFIALFFRSLEKLLVKNMKGDFKMFNIFKKKESDNVKSDNAKKYGFSNRDILNLSLLLYNRLVIGMTLSQAIENLSSKQDFSEEIASFLKEAFDINSEDELFLFKEREDNPLGIGKFEKSNALVNVIYKIKKDNMNQLQSLDILASLIENIRYLFHGFRN